MTEVKLLVHEIYLNELESTYPKRAAAPSKSAIWKERMVNVRGGYGSAEAMLK